MRVSVCGCGCRVVTARACAWIRMAPPNTLLHTLTPTHLRPHVLPHQEAQDGDAKHQAGEEGADEGRVPVPVLRLLRGLIVGWWVGLD